MDNGLWFKAGSDAASMLELLVGPIEHVTPM